jgi:SLT domain-containing protein
MAIILGLVSAANACESRTSSWCGKKHSASYNKKVIARVAKARGYGATNIQRLQWIANRESTYRNWVTSPGGACKGLFQLNTRASKSKWANPYWNTNQAITYIKKRYGTPAKAIAHIKKRGWY